MVGDACADAAFGGRRITGQRRVIARAATQLAGAFTVEELAEKARAVDPAAGSTATVYRAVSAMEATGFIERVGARAGQALYARCGVDHHHHHVICESCGRTAEASCPVDLGSLAETGFVLTRHEVTLYGLCPACSVEGSAR